MVVVVVVTIAFLKAAAAVLPLVSLDPANIAGPMGLVPTTAANATVRRKATKSLPLSRQ
jgi:hypothetical protein